MSLFSNLTRRAALVSAAAVILAASTGGAYAGDIKIGFLLKTMQEERYKRDRAAFVAKAEELGAEIIFDSANNDELTQLAKFENMLAKGADVIVLQPVNTGTAGSMVSMANSEGVRVVGYERMIPKVSEFERRIVKTTGDGAQIRFFQLGFADGADAVRRAHQHHQRSLERDVFSRWERIQPGLITSDPAKTRLYSRICISPQGPAAGRNLYTIRQYLPANIYGLGRFVEIWTGPQQPEWCVNGSEQSG